MGQSEFLFSDFIDQKQGFDRRKDFFSKKPAAKKKAVKKKVDPVKEDAKVNVEGAERSARKRGGELVTFSVTELTRLIKLTLDEHLPSKMVVTGEISNFKRHGSGHLYLTLKDDSAQIASVMWKGPASKLKFEAKDGLAVVATGRVDVYGPHGKIQFYIEKLEPSGVGALELAFREMAEKLKAEGLFDKAVKKPLPAYPGAIAIVTSGTGAAIEDIEKTLNRRFPSVRKLLYPVRVQGDGAAKEIAEAIGEINRRRDELGVDVMIVGRGGGSIEDLWAFNEEIVARAIYASMIPIISAVGHEVDLTIADLVADMRAATPTAGAELAVPDRMELLAGLGQMQVRLMQGVKRDVATCRQHYEGIGKRGFFARPMDVLREPRQMLDEVVGRLGGQVKERVYGLRRRMEEHGRTLKRIEPHTAVSRASKEVSELRYRLTDAVKRFTLMKQRGLDAELADLRAVAPVHRVRQGRDRLEHVGVRLERAGKQFVTGCEQDLKGLQGRLVNLDPRAVLQRGYSITRLKESGAIVKGEDALKAGDVLLTEMAGKRVIESEIKQVKSEK